VVSQDGNVQAVDDVISEFKSQAVSTLPGLKVEHLHHKQHPGGNGYEKLAVHFKWAMRKSFELGEQGQVKGAGGSAVPAVYSYCTVLILYSYCTHTTYAYTAYSYTAYSSTYSYTTCSYMPAVQRLIILEDDLELAPDFFEFMMATAPLLDADGGRTLMAISAWNDNGQAGKVLDPLYTILTIPYTHYILLPYSLHTVF
jgi:hypothetical protein